MTACYNEDKEGQYGQKFERSGDVDSSKEATLKQNKIKQNKTKKQPQLE